MKLDRYVRMRTDHNSLLTLFIQTVTLHFVLLFHQDSLCIVSCIKNKIVGTAANPEDRYLRSYLTPIEVRGYQKKT